MLSSAKAESDDKLEQVAKVIEISVYNQALREKKSYNQLVNEKINDMKSRAAKMCHSIH
ncbi:hypothetical protein BCR33DRAFT_719670 [Rhizoclosmatium globosum]|uniref:Uncharacterized protein n=1 Tax=Rhizoclosmatium globosum TaxID=329046 RepID=A0A1Y2BYJ5_9FUNG|nr:hypothetical protein BCR33DRAFT_719670 [Rhizoclosmatium globosum]|eukprot:ORY39843.1 hypothetical protein BCR33DRAFT_719670 [Rhizoclosmatium globosum]